jgi:hypothetical protein
MDWSVAPAMTLERLRSGVRQEWAMYVSGLPDIVYVVVGVLALGLWLWERHTNDKRQAALRDLAGRRGWSFTRDDGQWARRWAGAPFRNGFGRYPGARNAMVGVDAKGRPLAVFDYQSYDRSSYSNLRRQSVLAMRLPTPLPEDSVPRPGDWSAPHDPPLHLRVSGPDVLCWSDSLLRPEQILPAVTWLGSRVDSMLAAAAAALPSVGLRRGDRLREEGRDQPRPRSG